MSKRKWFTGVVLTLCVAVVLGSTAACSTAAPPDQVGLYYMKGPLDGYHFGHCFNPATKTSWGWNNEVILLPASQRTWNIAPAGGDSSAPIIVNGAPEVNQPSGVQVSLWVQFAFSLNTDCGAEGKDADSPLVQWWENIGRRYQANTEAGWVTMLHNTIVPAAETASRAIAREYQADVLVANTQREEVQERITELLQSELERLVGGNYYCKPTYDPRVAGSECGGVVVMLKDVDYTNPAIQQARDEKQAAIERAAAEVAAAQGKVKAAAELETLYQNPVWVELELARLQHEAQMACATNPNCTIVIGADGSIIAPGRNQS